MTPTRFIRHLLSVLALLTLTTTSHAQCAVDPAKLKADSLAYLAKTYPDKKVEPGNSDDTVLVDHIGFRLSNLRARICTTGGDKDEKIYNDALADYFSAMIYMVKYGNNSSEQLSWQDASKRVVLQLMPAVFQERLTGDKKIVARAFIPGLLQTTVFDSEKGYRFINQHDLEQWGITEEQLLLQGSRNLEAINFRTTKGMGGEPGAYLSYNTHDGYDAARILAPSVCKTAASTLGEPFYAIIPNRDFLMMWSGSLSNIVRAGMSAKGREDNARYDHPLSAKTLRVWGDCRVEVAD